MKPRQGKNIYTAFTGFNTLFTNECGIEITTAIQQQCSIAAKASDDTTGSRAHRAENSGREDW
jgi:hypothetical protein